jgi:translation initiation factor 1
MSNDNLVYSTGIGRITSENEKPAQPKGDGIVRIHKETKGRKGKGVCIIKGLDLPADELKKLCKELKKKMWCRWRC